MKRHRLRIVVPAYPTFNIYSRIACKTTALGPVCVATAVREIGGWDVEVIDENNLGRYGREATSAPTTAPCRLSVPRISWDSTEA